jgi:aspartate aminotransferase-like enzyme
MKLFLPGPVMLAQPVLDAMAQPMIDHRGKAFASIIDRIANALRPIFGTSSHVLLMGSSGTGGLEAAIANVFSPGDVVLSCGVGVFGKRFAEIAKTYGCVVESLETPLGASLDPDALMTRLEADKDRRIAGILLTHNETSTGVQNDMAAIAPIVRAHGALTLVDSVSGLAASPMRMDDWGYDIVVGASQKAIAAPPGVAAVAVSERAMQRIEAVQTPRFYFDLRRVREAHHNGQTPWTPPIPIFYALDVALQRYHTTGMEQAFDRHARYAAIVRTGLESLGFKIFSRPEANSVTVVAAYPPEGVEPAALLKALRENYGVVLSGGQAELAGKIVRFGTMGEITEDDLRAGLGAVESALNDLRVAI